MHQHLKTKDFKLSVPTTPVQGHGRGFAEKKHSLQSCWRRFFIREKKSKHYPCLTCNFTLNPNDEQSLRKERQPIRKRGNGETSVNKLLVIADDQGAVLGRVLCNVQSVLV